MSLLFRGAAHQRQFWYELALFTAWHTAAFTRQKRLKPWDEIQQRFAAAVETSTPTSKRKRAQQTPAEMQAAFEAIAAQINARRKDGRKA